MFFVHYNEFVQLQYLIWFSAMFYVDDGCHTEGGRKDDVEGTYESILFEAGVRCCGTDGRSCKTVGNCPSDKTTYDDAVSKCKSVNARLCTKDELLKQELRTGRMREVCCGTGGACDHYAVWTSTQGSGENVIFLYCK